MGAVVEGAQLDVEQVDHLDVQIIPLREIGWTDLEVTTRLRSSRSAVNRLW